MWDGKITMCANCGKWKPVKHPELADSFHWECCNKNSYMYGERTEDADCCDEWEPEI